MTIPTWAPPPDIVLPPPRMLRIDRGPRRLETTVPLPVAVPSRLAAIDGLEVVRVRTAAQRGVWNTLIAREPPRGLTPFAGCQVRCLVSSRHGTLDSAGFSAAALQTEARARWIAWSAQQRQDELHRILCRSRFLVRPSVQG